MVPYKPPGSEDLWDSSPTCKPYKCSGSWSLRLPARPPKEGDLRNSSAQLQALEGNGLPNLLVPASPSWEYLMTMTITRKPQKDSKVGKLVTFKLAGHSKPFLGGWQQWLSPARAKKAVKLAKFIDPCKPFSGKIWWQCISPKKPEKGRAQPETCCL